ncbi:MAG: hypothetical protein A2231_10540 [Candidatus Firestonebacteria bacterium RIFOXYA2_FULL_40_8]|nr:MAG: hypothetical protein A2231_10540 [Candidatus Firestonebacteria bacterium RIFOXYA2_FULL_40_8]
MRNEAENIKKTAMLVACASVLQIAEFLLPSPLPGVKLGLANIVTLVVLSELGFKAALEVAILRTVVSSLIVGTFLSPTFLMSLSGAFVSTLVMGSIYKIFGLISVSVIGSVTHIAVQMLLVYLLLIKNTAVFLMLPWLGLSAVIMGWLTGLIAIQVINKLRSGETESFKDTSGPVSPLASKLYLNTGSKLHAFPATAKIFISLILMVLVLLFSNAYFYSVVFIFLLLLGTVSKVPAGKLFSGIIKLRFFLIFSFIIPALFGGGNHTLFEYGFLKVTVEGCFTGVMFVYRLAALMLITSLMMTTTAPEALAESLKKYFGERVSRVMTLSWSYVPIFWEKSNRYIRSHKVDGKLFGKVLPIAVSLLVMLYMETEKYE